MSTESILEERRQIELKRLLVRAEKIAKEKTYRHLKGMIFSWNILALDIDRNHTVYINLAEKSVSLVTIHNLDSVAYDSLDNLYILHHLLSCFEEELQKFNSRSFIGKLFSLSKIPEQSSISFFRKAETFYYKSLLTARISNLCFNNSHQYAFVISGGVALIIHLPGRYLTDEGVYFLEKQTGPLTVLVKEEESPDEVLAAIKHLVDHEEILRATK